MFVLVIGLCGMAGGFQQRVTSIFVEPPARNRVWLLASFLCLSLQLGFSYAWVVLHRSGAEASGAGTWAGVTGEYVIVGGLVVPAAVMLMDELAKRYDRPVVNRGLFFLRQEFDTRLGMYSPK